MGYHAINNGGSISVYNHSNCVVDSAGGSVIGTLYNQECFTYIGGTSYQTKEIRFLNSSGRLSGGFINTSSFSNLTFSGAKTNMDGVGTCYRFKTRKPLTIVSNSNTFKALLSTGDSIYTTTATSGASNSNNMAIVGYRKDGVLYRYSGFVTLNYTGGSMLNSNFCIYPG